MDNSSKTKINWQLDSIPQKTKKALDFLSKQSWLGGDGWYLAGGTALSLQSGHRRSVDLDFFTKQSNFKAEDILKNFLDNEYWEITIAKDNTIYGELFGAKISFIAYPFFIPQQKKLQYGSIQVLQATDIAVMKIIAISQRGTKRDFFDLYWCAKNIELLEDIIKKLKKQYPAVAHDYHHILKSLVYFEDAENDPMPEINFSINWKQVKSFFRKEIPIITKNIIRL